MAEEQTTIAVQRYLDVLGGGRGDGSAEPIVGALLGRAVSRLHLLCTNLLVRNYPRLARPPLNLQGDELLSAVVERLLKATREVHPQTVRQFFALANQHMRWELNDVAPEQVTNRTGEVGAILYEMLTGRPPFRADTAADTERQLVTDEPVRPSRLNTKVPRDLETICLKCLRKDPRRRYASAAALHDDLRRFGRGEPIAARPVGQVERTVKWARRRPAVAVTLASTCLLALVITGSTAWLVAQASTRTRVIKAEEMRDVVELERQGRWDDARALAARARIELASHGPPELGRSLDQCDHDLDLVGRLDAIQHDQMGILGGDKETGTDAKYAAALTEYGLVPFGPDKRAVELRIQQSPIRIALVDTLDQWGMAVDTPEHRDWLLAVARAADDDQTPWKRSARDPDRWRTLQAFDPVIAAAPVADRSVSLLYALALHYQLLGKSPIPLLTRLQQNHPTDLRANLLLGTAYG